MERKKIPNMREEVKRMMMILREWINNLEPILNQLTATSNLNAKLTILDMQPIVQEALRHLPHLPAQVASVNIEEQIAVKSVLVIGQGKRVFFGLEKTNVPVEKIRNLFQQLTSIDKFYSCIGGIIGYHVTVLKLMEDLNKGVVKDPFPDIQYLYPEGIDLTDDSDVVRAAVRTGIEYMGEMAELYPIGGVGERLNLRDEITGEPLPVALLPFLGRTLLEGLVRDLQAREYLHFKLYGKQVTVPIAMMTSLENKNDSHIRSLCEKAQWFGRHKTSYLLMLQPSAPVINRNGSWCLSAPMELVLRPGGHGLIWKIGLDCGLFSFLEKSGCRKALVRQINNPVAGTDHALLAFSGIGFQFDKVMGFASCPRLLKAAEGTNVIIETRKKDGFEYCQTNIEYTDFTKKHIDDLPIEVSSPYSRFPSNTNILFVDLKKIAELAQAHPIPGQLINLKSKFPCMDESGDVSFAHAGRLESTMQNIADYIKDLFPYKISAEERNKLQTFLTFNVRRKTTSVTKSAYIPGHSLRETPENAFYDLMQNQKELLALCCMKTPVIQSPEDYLAQGPSFMFIYHPALGPNYTIISQKIQGGELSAGSELQLEIAELCMKDVEINGSLLIEARDIIGCRDPQGHIKYTSSVGRCLLRNVKINNKGIRRDAQNIYWKNKIVRDEAAKIIIHGNGELVAENLQLDGDFHIEVPSGQRLTLLKNGNELERISENIQTPSWQWKYTFDFSNNIVALFTEKSEH